MITTGRLEDERGLPFKLLVRPNRQQARTTVKYENSSLTKAFDILEALGKARQPQPLAAVCEATGFNKTTAFRLLQVLDGMGYVTRTESGYALGYRLYQLTLNMSGSATVRRLAHPFLVRLARTVGETVHLGILDQTRVSLSDKIDTERSLRIDTHAGVRLEAHATGLGKALLAQLADESVRQLYDGVIIKANTSRTITDFPQLLRALKQIRHQGFAVDNEEFELGLRCVAVPVFGAHGQAVCAVSISGPTVRVTDTALPQLITELRSSARAIEAALISGSRAA